MAVSCDNYTGDGSTVTFNLTFEYRKESEIYVSINETANYNWTLSTATTLTFTSAPANGAKIKIYRSTDLSSMDAVFAPGSAIRAKDLNDDFDQLRLAIQEGVDASDQNESDINALDVRITKNETDIAALDVRVTKNEGDIVDIKNDISDINTDASALEARVTQNETDIAKNASDIAALDNNLTSLGNDVAQNTTDIATNTANIAVNATNIATNTTNIGTNTANIATNTANIATNTANIATNTANIAQNTSDIADLKAGGSYTLPIASASVLGGIKVGNNLTIDANGTLSATGGGGTVPGGGAVDSVNGKTGTVVLDASDVGAVETVNGKTGTSINLNASDVGALESGDNISELVNDSGYLASGDNVSDLANDANYISNGDNISELTNDVGYITAASAPVTSVNGQTGAVSLNAADVGAISNITSGNGIQISGTQISLYNGTGIEIDGDKKAILGDLDKVKDVVVSGIQDGQVLKWDAANSQWKNSPEVAVPGALVFIGQIDATTQYPPAADIIAGHFWISNKPDKDTGKATADAQWTTVDQSVTPHVQGPTLQVQYGDMIAVGAEHDISGTMVRNHVVFGNVVTGTTIGLQPGDNVSLLVNDANYTSTGDNISVFNNDAGYVTAAQVPAAPGNGVLTIKLFNQSGDNQSGSFTANQGSNSTITLPQIDYNNLVNKPSIPSVNNGQININGGDGITASGNNASANQSANTTRTLKIDTSWLGTWIDNNKAPGNGSLTIETAGEGASSTGTFTANQSGASTLTLPVIRYQDLSGKPSIPSAPGNGTLTIKTAGEGASATGSFSANQGTNSTLTLPAIRWADISGKPSIPSAAGNGQINVNAGNGLEAAGTNATANQSGNTTRTLSVKASDNTISVGASGISVNAGNLNIPAAANNGQINVSGGAGITASGSNATANQSGNTTRTLAIDTAWLGTWLDNNHALPAVGNGQININGGSGISASGNNATANQSGNTTRTLAVDNTVIRTTGNQSMAGTKTFTGTIGLSATTKIALESLPALP